MSELLKASPPRVALFLSAGQKNILRMEAEQCVARSAYLPIEGECFELHDIDAVCVGRSVRDALKQFNSPYADTEALGLSGGWLGRLLPSTQKPAGWPDLSPEKRDQMRSLCMSGDRHRGVAGFSNPNVDTNARCLVITHHEGVLELWPATTTSEGRFVEGSWPHIPLSDSISDAELGDAVMAAFSQCVTGENL